MLFGLKIRHEGNCSATRGLPSDAERISRMTEFSVRTEQPLQIFPCILFFRRLHLGLNICCFINFTLKLLHFFDQEMFGSAPLLYSDVETFGGNWREKWRQDVKNDVKTSKSSYLCHARGSSYTPPCNTKFLGPGRVHENSGRVCKKSISLS